MKSEDRNEAEIRSYAIKELAFLYDVSVTTLTKWIDKFAGETGRTTERILTVKQVEIIFEKLGRPNKRD